MERQPIPVTYSLYCALPTPAAAAQGAQHSKSQRGASAYCKPLNDLKTTRIARYLSVFMSCSDLPAEIGVIRLTKDCASRAATERLKPIGVVQQCGRQRPV